MLPCVASSSDFELTIEAARVLDTCEMGTAAFGPTPPQAAGKDVSAINSSECRISNVALLPGAKVRVVAIV